MKNIHVIPTDKPSRLSILNSGKLNFGAEFISSSNSKAQHIYITSDEEIKEGDWFINFDLLGRLDTIYDPIHKCLKVNNSIITSFENKVEDEFTILKSFCKKIILTTDQDLDGVQAIDDDFLEWFVKNPSCEEVDVWINKFYGNKKEMLFNVYGKYKIIIPKQEPKKNFYCGDEVDYDDKCLEQCDRCVDATGVDYGYLPNKEPEQELGILDVPTPIYKHIESINNNIDEFDKKLKESKQRPEKYSERFDKGLSIEDNMETWGERTVDDFGAETLENIKLEKVYGSQYCRYSVIENKLSALYRNQEQILKSIKISNIGQQRSYNEKEAKQLSFDFYYDMSRKMNVPENLITENITNLDVWFEQYKKK